MDHEHPRISLPNMRVWLRIKADFAREGHAQGRRVCETAQSIAAPARRAASAVTAGSVFKRVMFYIHWEQYVDQWSTIAQANIRINGRDFDSLQPHEQDAEPFDEALDRKIWALASSRLEWQSQDSH
ncbi:hypothetical protein B0H14DRAFT_718137 [Mycena olivaceomarginata]|nr:hypothetical protein B0H14DRAFT_718137 [Mycena olivaceomarginata]